MPDATAFVTIGGFELDTKICSSILILLSLNAADALATGWYGGAYGGYALFDDEEERAQPGAPFSLENENGWQGGVAAGYRFAEQGLGNWRAEFDFRYQDADLESSRLSSTSRQQVDLATYTFMMKGLYDFKLSSMPKWRPYLGLGLGMVVADGDPHDGSAGSMAGRSDTVFAGEASAGITYLYTERVNLFFDVRYLLADDPSAVRVTATSAAERPENDVNALGLNLGVRYNF